MCINERRQAQTIVSPNATISSQKPKLNDRGACNKQISNCLVDHQVHAAFSKTTLFQVNDDCKGIEGHYNKSLHANHR